MSMKKQFTPQRLIDGSPDWIKSGYVALMRHTKAVLAASGALNKLDQKAKTSRQFHYLRSLLAIHDLPDMVGLDIPWWTYSAIDFIASHLETLEKPIKVFEWGSGASTLWLAKRADKVISIEHDSKWYALLQPFLLDYPNVQSILVEPEHLLIDEKFTSNKILGVNFKSYVTSITNYPDQYDLIIIDGRARAACLQSCIPFLAPHGMVIFDNSNRERYQNALLHTGLEVKRFKGKVPCSPLTSETAVLTIPK